MTQRQPYILIVDDENGLRTGTKRLLESEGYVVETAENGTVGIELGTSKDFDLAVIDLKMPDIGGLEVLEEIKKARPNTVCFIATAFASYDTAIESTRIGAYSYIPKPFTPDELISELEKGFSQRLLLLEAERLHKEREERLLELANEKSRLNTIIRSITGGVLVINRMGEVVYFNDPILKNLDLEELTIGDYILDKIQPEIVELVNKHLKSNKFIQKSYSKQLEIKPANELVIEAICSPVPQPDKSLAGVVVVVRNITELKKIEHIKSQFVSMVAHELKTPVAAVQGFLQILLDDKVEVSYEQQKDFLSRSVIRLKGLLDLVNDLLDISRMELKTKQREIVEINVRETMDSTLTFLELEMRKKGLELIKEYDNEIPQIKADQNEIIRVFTNILSNAIKYNKDQGSITIVLTSSKNYLVVKISDTGIGLKEHELENLFQEFFRAKNEKTRGISGTGLGLNIVKRIIESYHGKIDVESKFDEGTTFTIYIPKINNK